MEIKCIHRKVFSTVDKITFYIWLFYLYKDDYIKGEFDKTVR